MSSILPKHWLPIVEKFLTLGLVLKRQRVSAGFDSEKFNAGWDEFMRHAHEIEEILRKEPKGGWPKNLTRFKEFGQGVSRFLATYQDGSRPELVAEALTTCISKAETVMVCEQLSDYEPEPVAEPKPVEGPAREPTVEEPKPKKGPGGRKKKVTLEHIKDYGENIKDKLPGVTLKILSDRWGIAKSTIADSPFWKKLRGQKMIARERAQNKSKPKTPKGIERRAVASQNWHEEDMKKIDEDLDGDS